MPGIRDDMNDPAPTIPAKLRIGESIGFLFMVALVGIFPSYLYLNGLWEAQQQYRVNTTYMRVAATVLSVGKTRYRESHNYYYEVQVHYQYVVDGKTYQSDRFTAISIHASEDWANDAVTEYKARSSKDAYYNPGDPSQAVLNRYYTARPYFEMLQGVLLLTMGFFTLAQLWAAKKRELVPTVDGWLEVRPKIGQRHHLLAAKLCTVVWYGLGAVAAAHFSLCFPAPYPQRMLHFFEGFGVLGLIPLAFLIRYLRASANFEDARLLVTEPAAVLGQSFRFRITQLARRPLHLTTVSVDLVCIGMKGKNRRRIYEAPVLNLKNRDLYPGETLDLPAETTLPPDQRPSGRDAKREFGLISWELRFRSKVMGGPGYFVIFPITVQAPIEELEPEGKSSAVVEVRPVEPEYAGRILTRLNIAISYSTLLIYLGGLLLGLFMVGAVFPVLFPDGSGTRAYWDLPKPQAELVFGGGVVLAILASVVGLAFPSFLAGTRLHAVARRNIERRRDAIVRPGPESIYVDVIPRKNWNRLMWENASDIGFLTVDTGRRQIRFEGDRERYRIPAAALLDCKLERIYNAPGATGNAPGCWLVVIRAAGPNGVWEAPVTPRLYKRRVPMKERLRVAQELLDQIKAIRPTQDLEVP